MIKTNASCHSESSETRQVDYGRGSSCEGVLCVHGSRSNIIRILFSVEQCYDYKHSSRHEKKHKASRHKTYLEIFCHYCQLLSQYLHWLVGAFQANAPVMIAAEVFHS